MANQNVRVCGIKDISQGQGKSFKVGTLELAVFHSEGKFFAVCDICSHEYEHLHDGWLEGMMIECPRHGSQFDLLTGEAMSLPATDPIEVFEVKVEGEDVMVSVPEEYLTNAGVRKET